MLLALGTLLSAREEDNLSGLHSPSSLQLLLEVLALHPRDRLTQLRPLRLPD